MDASQRGKRELLENLYNPDDVGKWMDSTPEDVIGIIGSDLISMYITIRGWTEILHNAAELQNIVLDVNGISPMPITEITQHIISCSDLLIRMINTLRAYGSERRRRSTDSSSVDTPTN